MNKFTPGPWEVDGRTIYALESAGFYRGVERFQNRFSALVQSPRSSIPELEANALLIAAAPDLMEALQLVVDTAENGGWPSAALFIAKAAIAKARGES